MLNVLGKTVKQIEQWQENCAELQLFIQKLLGPTVQENVSIADIAVTKDGMSPKKNKEMDEAVVTKDNRRYYKNGQPVSPEDQVTMKREIRRGRTIVAGEEDEAVSPLQEPSDSAETEEPTPDADEPQVASTDGEKTSRAKILKTEKVMETNSILNKWVGEYFSDRRAGNFNEAMIIKKRIERMIKEKDLDRDTVYYSGSTGASLEEPDAEGEDSETTETENKLEL